MLFPLKRTHVLVGAAPAATLVTGDLRDKSDVGDGQRVTFVTYVTYVTLYGVAAERLLQ